MHTLARACEELGAGEILLNCIDKDGTNSGFDLELIKMVKEYLQRHGIEVRLLFLAAHWRKMRAFSEIWPFGGVGFFVDMPVGSRY